MKYAGRSSCSFIFICITELKELLWSNIQWTFARFLTIMKNVLSLNIYGEELIRTKQLTANSTMLFSNAFTLYTLCDRNSRWQSPFLNCPRFLKETLIVYHCLIVKDFLRKRIQHMPILGKIFKLLCKFGNHLYVSSNMGIFCFRCTIFIHQLIKGQTFSSSYMLSYAMQMRHQKIPVGKKSMKPPKNNLFKTTRI